MSIQRLLTKEVPIGNMIIGGNNPIRIQSMTTTNTMDTKETVKQIIALHEVGCEIVRVTAPNIENVKNLKEIKKELRHCGISIPLVADIHFTPKAAIEAAKIVEKVRINPGNYVDKKQFKVTQYTEKEYHLELEKIYDQFSPLVKTCKEHGCAMRIGTNHGSLSDRIMNYYGDTPLGMVMSAFEFLDICEDLNFTDIVFSMKASNPFVMIEAYEVFVQKMKERGQLYPLHLGVTEAGFGEEGRIKSAIGIGSLLAQGMGDTIRVSLTEDPIEEIPVCQDILNYYQNISTSFTPSFNSFPMDPYPTSFSKSPKDEPQVITNISHHTLKEEDWKILGYPYVKKVQNFGMMDIKTDYVYTKEKPTLMPSQVSFIVDGTDFSSEKWKSLKAVYPLWKMSDINKNTSFSKKLNFILLEEETLSKVNWSLIQNHPIVFIWTLNQSHQALEIINIKEKLQEYKQNHPIIFTPSLLKKEEDSGYETLLACELSLGLIKGAIDGVWLDYQKSNKSIEVVLDCYQASRKRIIKTEFISCPSCGRTHFNLQEVTQMIKKKTSHLKKLKIAIMGCIVNGPGEMADADFGYVGVGHGKITLYKGKEIIKRNLPEETALDGLISLIKENGLWTEPNNDIP